MGEDIFGMTMGREWNERFQKNTDISRYSLYTDFQFLLMAERNFQQPFSHGGTEGTEERQKTGIWFWLFLREQLAVGYFDLVFSLRASVSP
jgi:hypothetical protein